MALVKDIKVGDRIGHYGSFRKVVTNSPSTDGNFVLVVEEDFGFVSNRIENGKTNLVVKGE